MPNQMLIIVSSHLSISYFNLANLFNLTYVDDVSIPTLNDAPKVQPFLSAMTCGDGLNIHSLLQRADSAESNVHLDGTVQSAQRYHDPMEEVLEWIALEGSKHRDHVCSGCVRVVPIPGDEGDKPKVGCESFISSGPHLFLRGVRLIFTHI